MESLKIDDFLTLSPSIDDQYEFASSRHKLLSSVFCNVDITDSPMYVPIIHACWT